MPLSQDMLSRIINVHWVGNTYQYAAGLNVIPNDNTIAVTARSAIISAPGYGSKPAPLLPWLDGQLAQVSFSFFFDAVLELKQLFGKPLDFPAPDTITIDLTLSWHLKYTYNRVLVIRGASVTEDGTGEFKEIDRREDVFDRDGTAKFKTTLKRNPPPFDLTETL